MGVGEINGVGDNLEQVKRYCDHIGVTDKYTGFRHNLTRGNREPVTLGYSWMRNNPPSSAPPPPISSLQQCSTSQDYSHMPAYTRDTTRQTDAFEHSPSMTARRHENYYAKSIQERCGINTKFPGRSEYMKRYHQIKAGQHTVPVQNVKRGYTLNPAPDFEAVAKRPLASHERLLNQSEYQYRYFYPDGNRIVKFPWLRK